jgi:CRP-like cAMP-binding protein
MDEALSVFKKYLNSIVSMSDQSFDLCRDLVKYRKVEKNEILLREGEKSNFIFFTVSGLLRNYHLKDVNEVNTCFCLEKSIACSFESFVHDTASQEYIQALEKSTVLQLSRKDMMKLIEIDESWSQLRRELTEIECIRLSNRVSAMNFATASEKYLALMDKEPELIQRVSVQYIASYLGISRETISRIRAKVVR